MTRHFLTLQDLSAPELRQLIGRARELKSASGEARRPGFMRGRTMVLIFEKSSTRTRVSFEVACSQFGGHPVFLAPGDSQMSRGESLSDTARIISSMADIIVMRTSGHERVVAMAAASRVPVVNALSDSFHPCQLLADILTFAEHRGELSGAKVAFIGDGSGNVCQSWINAAALLDFSLSIATPAPYQPDPALAKTASGQCTVTDQPKAAVAAADLVVTDAWTGMGQEDQKVVRQQAFAGFCVTAELMTQANKDALFMHCLPAYRGQEVSSEVIDGPRSVVWDEAENRLHAQKALLEFLLDGTP